MVVGVVGSRRRAPDHEDRFGRGLRRLDHVARQRIAEHRDRARDRDDEDVDVLVGEDRVDDLPAAPIGDRRSTAVDRIRHAQIRGNQTVVQRRLRRLGEHWQPEPGVGEHVGHVRAGTAGDRVHAHARTRFAAGPRGDLLRLRARERGGNLEELVEPADARDAELAEHRARDRVGSGEVTGVRLRHRAAGFGLADLHHHHRLAQLRGVIGREHQRAAVFEAFDVTRDHADFGLIGEVPGEVGELEVDLVAGRRPVREPDPDLLALEHGPALVPRLRDERDRRAFEIFAEVFERVEVRVGAEQAHLTRTHQSVEPRLELLALGPGLGEARPRRSPRTWACAGVPARTCRPLCRSE